MASAVNTLAPRVRRLAAAFRKLVDSNRGELRIFG